LAAYVLSDAIEGESREVAKVHAALARAVAQTGQPFATPCVILSGGETTVTVRPLPAGAAKGRGGRAGEFCMGLALALQGQNGVWALAADTDGIDGVQDNAGAYVAPDTLARAQALGAKLVDHLDRNDAYGYFEALGDLLVTGPTHTNVNDFRAILVL
jgi:hydroxypyruvate reductase